MTNLSFSTSELPALFSLKKGKEVNSKKKKQQRRKNHLWCKGSVIRLAPTPEQASLFRQWMGAGRFLWNQSLAQQKLFYEEHQKHLSSAELSKTLTQQREQPEYAWLKQVPRTVLTQALNHLKTSWDGFYKGLQGKRLDSPGMPQFRRKNGSRESMTFQIDSRVSFPIYTDAKGQKFLRVPGLKSDVRIQYSEKVVGEISQLTIRQKGNQWLAALTLINVENHEIRRAQKNEFGILIDPKAVVFSDDPTNYESNPDREGVCAFDASAVNGAVGTSDGKTTYTIYSSEQEKVNQKNTERLKAYQRVYNRKMDALFLSAGLVRDADGKWPKGAMKLAALKGKKPSNRMEDVRIEMVRLNLKELFRKKDILHQFTTKMVRNHHTIVVETLALKGMMKAFNRGFRRSIHQASLGEILRQLEYKCAWYGRTLIKVERWFASSKRCSNTDCHEKNSDLILQDRQWVCAHCDQIHDRDENAAFNLWQEGWRLLEEVFQHQSAEMLAAGSVVRGSSGVLFEAKARVPKPQKKRLSDQSSIPMLTKSVNV